MTVVQHAASSPVRCTYSETGFPWRLYDSDTNYDDRKNLSKKKLKNFSFVIYYLFLLALSTRPRLATLQSRTLNNIWLQHGSFRGSGRISRQSWKLMLSNIIVQLKHHLGRATSWHFSSSSFCRHWLFKLLQLFWSALMGMLQQHGVLITIANDFAASIVISYYITLLKRQNLRFITYYTKTNYFTSGATTLFSACYRTSLSMSLR